MSRSSSISPIARSRPGGPDVLSRIAWMVWGVFAGAIWVATLVKPDVFVLSGGRQLSGRVVDQIGETSVVIRTGEKDGRGQAIPDITLDRSSIAQWYRFGGRSVTPEYQRAATLWWRSQPMYTEGVHGFLYLPQAAMLYSPFAILPPILEVTLWRLVNIAAYAFGIWRLSRLLFGERWTTGFLFATALAIPAALGSATNGQTNLVIGGLFALAAADLIDKRWWRVTLWLMLALACKPTAIVMILLVGAIYLRPMGWRLAIGLLVLAVLPFVHPNPGYVQGQYHDCFVKMAAASEPGDRFQDIRGMLMDFGVVRVEKATSAAGGEFAWVQTPPESVLMAVRALAAIVTLGLCWLAARRFGDPARAVFLFTLAAIYLMLFNPRTEGVSYAILGPAAAIWATREIMNKRWWSATPLVMLCLVLQFSRQVQVVLAATVFRVLPVWLTPHVGTDTSGANYWVRPIATLIFAGLVVYEIAKGRTRWPTRDPNPRQ